MSRTAGRPDRQERPKPRTRFDNYRRNLLVAIAVLVTTIIIALAGYGGAFNTLSENIQTRQASRDPRPRNVDIWMVYPDNTVRFVTMFYPEAGTAAGAVTAAGPLLRAEADIMSETVFGGTLVQSDIYPSGAGSPDTADPLLYTLYTIQYGGGSDPYGVDVRSGNSPYISTLADGLTRAAIFGVQESDFYEKVIVAVALPPGTKGPPGLPAVTTAATSLPPYQTLRISGWTVLYFDTTLSPTARRIQVEFTPTSETRVPELDYRRVEARRGIPPPAPGT